MRLAWFVSVVAAAAGIGCGASVPPAAPVEAPRPAASATTAPAPRLPELRRSDVIATLSQGPGAFLQRLDVEPALVDGRFRGFRIVALHGGPDAWRGVDLRPGDVVTGVNGYPIERPEQAFVPWQSLAVVSELEVSYERDGAARELRFAIVDDVPPVPGGAPGPAAAAAPEPARPAAAPTKKTKKAR